MRNFLLILTGTMIFIILSFTSYPVFPEEGSQSQDKITKMTLADSIFIALRNNRSLKSAYLNRTLQKFSLVVAEDEFIPDLNLDFSASRNSSFSGDTRLTSDSGDANLTITQRIPTSGTFNFVWSNSANRTDDGDDTTYGASWNLSFSQPLLKGGGLEVGTASLRISRISEEQNILSYKGIIMDTITSTILSFRSYLQAERQLEISKKSLKRAKQLLEINKALIKAGRMAKVEIVQTEADIANREFSLLSTKNNLDSARLALIQVLDIDKETYFETVSETEIPEVQLDFEELRKIAFSNRPDYLQSLLSLEISRINLAVAKNNMLWDLSLTANAGRNESDTEFDSAIGRLDDFGKTEWGVGLRLNIPLYGDLSRDQSLLNAKVALQQQEISIQEQRESIEIAVKDAIRDVRMKLKQVELARHARALSEQKLEIENVKLKAGRSTNFQLVTFEDDLVSAQNNELDAVVNYLNALTNIDRMLGNSLITWEIGIEDGIEITTDASNAASYKSEEIEK